MYLFVENFRTLYEQERRRQAYRARKGAQNVSQEMTFVIASSFKIMLYIYGVKARD